MYSIHQIYIRWLKLLPCHVVLSIVVDRPEVVDDDYIGRWMYTKIPYLGALAIHLE